MEALKIIENHSYSFLDDYSKKIKDSVQNIKQEYFYIGALLNEVDCFGCYSAGGYKNIVEYCEDVFGFKKTFTYDLMKVASYFRDPLGTMFSIEPKYKDYDFSKLCVMAGMNAKQLSLCSPDYTVKEIKHIKRYGSVGTDSENSVRTAKEVSKNSVRMKKEVSENSVRAEKVAFDTVENLNNLDVLFDVPFFAFEDEDIDMAQVYFGINLNKGKYSVLITPFDSDNVSKT